MALVLHGSDTNRFLTSQMPDDNILPADLANRLWEGGPTKPFWGMTVIQVSPFVGDWLSSDRPPLQAAIDLVFRPFEFLRFNPNDIYVIVSTLCQAIWVPAIYILVRQLRFSRYATGYTLIWFAGCGFFLFHTVYTWPKLLSAALFLTGMAVLLYCEKKLPERNPAALLILGLLWSLALLAHGGILFSFLAIPFFPAAWRVAIGAPVPVLGALAVFVLMSIPWAVYQKYYDPPANRLIKMHLAGVDDVDPRGTFETLRDSYSSLTFSQWCQNRLGNVKTSLLWDNPDKWHVSQSAIAMRQYLNCEVFFRLSAALGFLNIGFVLLAAGWIWKKLRGPLDDTGWGELLVMNIGCYLIWIVMMFHPDGAIVHQGSFAMVILFMLIAIVGVMRLPVWMSGALLALEWVQFVFCRSFFLLHGSASQRGVVGLSGGILDSHRAFRRQPVGLFATDFFRLRKLPSTWC